MKVSYLGTTVLLFDDGKNRILFDAHLTRPGMLRYMFGKVSTDEPLIDRLSAAYHFDRLDAVFISHSHYDHVMDMPYIACLSGCDVYGSASARNVGAGGGVPADKLHVFRPHESIDIGNFNITVLPSLHSKPTIFNNDIGATIDRPLTQPARCRDYKEGGSYDFVIKHLNDTYVIRPSFNYIKDEFKDIRADVLFCGVAGIAGADKTVREAFVRETIDSLEVKKLIPVHWDNFFRPVDSKDLNMPVFISNTGKTLRIIKSICDERNIEYIGMRPLSDIEL